MSAHVILGSFEAELDSLIALATGDNRSGTIEETLIRRLRSDEELYEELSTAMERIELKMTIARDRVFGGALQR